MNRYFKLVNMEINRFSKILYGMIISVFIIQIAGVIISSKSYMSKANESFLKGVPKETFLEEYGKYGMGNYTASLWFTAPIALCAGAIFFYIFLIWYRDWTGKNAFIYRLLMIPTSRMSIYFSKLTVLMLLVFTLVTAQLIFLPIESKIMEWFISADYLKEIPVSALIIGNEYLWIIIPPTLTQFILYYGAGFIVLTILFSAVLLERSFKWKGIILAIVYCAIVLGLFVSPILIIDFFDKSSYFYQSEEVMIESVVALIIGAISILLSRYLLNKKVTV